MAKKINKRSLFVGLAASAALVSVGGVANSYHNDGLALQAATPVTQRYSFEAWEQRLVGGIASHALIVLVDHKSGQAVTLQGLATNRDTGATAPVGLAPSNLIYTYVNVQDQQDLAKKYEKRAVLYQTNNEADVALRLTNMMETAKAINEKGYSYQLLSLSALAPGVAYNSNATATTLARAGGFDLQKVRFHGWAPGEDQVIPETVNSLKSQRHALSGLKANNVRANIIGLVEDINAAARNALNRKYDEWDVALLTVNSSSNMNTFIDNMDVKNNWGLTACRTNSEGAPLSSGNRAFDPAEVNEVLKSKVTGEPVAAAMRDAKTGYRCRFNNAPKPA